MFVSFFRDLRLAARVLLRSPVATTVAVLALALGIGVNASSFITASSLILHPLPYPHLERIVTLWETIPELRSERTALAPADFLDLRNQSSSFASVAAYRPWDANLTGIGNPERVQAYFVSPELFSVLGGHARLGRTFLENEEQPSRAKVAVVSEGFWKTHLASSPAAVGRQISLNRQKYTVVGIMPDSFDYPLGTDVWAPLTFTQAEQSERNSHNLMALGLLKPGTSAGQASAETAAIATRLGKQFPQTNQGRSMLAVPLRDLVDAVTSRFVMTLIGAAGFVLLLACANIGNLQLARAANREKEIAVRAALGASRFQLARQLIAECFVISGAAGGIGLLLASWNNDVGKSSIPAVALRLVPGLRTMHVDSTVVLLTIAVSLLAGLLSSAPAISQSVYQKMRSDLNDSLRGRGTGNSSPVRNRLRSGLIVVELALALVLLVGAGLMVKTFERLLHIDQGFDPRNLLTMQVSLPAGEYGDSSQIRSFYDRVLEGLDTLRGVTAAGMSSRLDDAEQFGIEGRPAPRAGEPRPEVLSVSSQYLQAMRIPLLDGRFISGRDRPNSQPVVVISKSIARHYWHDSSPIGHRIKLDPHSDWLTVVGVCGDIVEDWFGGQPAPAAYVSYAQFPNPHAAFLLRTTGDPMQAAAGARRQFRSVDSDLPVYELKTMEQSIYEERSGVRAAARMMTSYAVIALLLAATGIYAVISYFVTAHTHDIGVRIALGATRAEILKIMMNQTIRLVAVGLAFGIPLAILLARVMSSALYGVVNLDPLIFAGFAAVLTFSALLASYLPSRRATRIDPIAALREE